MTSVVSICNLALSNIGKDNIQALSDKGAEARACRQFYDHTRDMLLQSHPWNFAGKIEALAEVTNDRPRDWAFVYQRPSDCLKVRFVQRSPIEVGAHEKGMTDMGFPYSVEGQLIYCGISPAYLNYTCRVTDASKFPPLFVEALSWHLAVRLAMPLTRDPKIRADAYQLAVGAASVAAAADANEVRHTYDHVSDFARARGATPEKRLVPMTGDLDSRWIDEGVWNG